MADIDFFTFITKGSSDYAEFLRETCLSLCSGKHNINWKCIESVNAERLPKGYTCVDKTGDKGHNSLNHSLALNVASKHVESKYVVYADADIAIVHKDWDDIIVNELNTVDCFGFGYPKEDPKYQNFPTVYLFCYRSHVLEKIDLDFRPKLRKDAESPFRYKVVDKKESQYFNIKIGGQIKCDTGWKLPLIFKEAGLSSSFMENIFMTNKRSLLPFVSKKQKQRCMTKPTHMSEWHYKGKLFGTHKQASRNHPLDGEWGSAWVQRIEKYLKDEYNIDISRS